MGYGLRYCNGDSYISCHNSYYYKQDLGIIMCVNRRTLTRCIQFALVFLLVESYVIWGAAFGFVGAKEFNLWLDIVWNNILHGIFYVIYLFF